MSFLPFALETWEKTDKKIIAKKYLKEKKSNCNKFEPWKRQESTEHLDPIWCFVEFEFFKC